MMVRLAGILHTSFDYLATGAHSSEEHGEPSEVIARARQDVASAFGLDVSQVRIVLTDEGEELAA